MPDRCRTCHKGFSTRTETELAPSRLPLQKWTYATYLDVTLLKGASSLNLYRALGITQTSA